MSLLTPEEAEEVRRKKAEIYHVSINGHVFDTSAVFSLSERIFSNFAGSNGQQKREYAHNSRMDYKEFISFHEKRLGVSLKGLLELKNVSTGRVLCSAYI